MRIFPTPTLKTPRLILREVGESDWQQILHLRSDPQLNAFVKRPLAKTKEDAIAFIERLGQDNQAESIVYWGIALLEANEVLGSICLWHFSKDRKTAEVGYDLSVAAQGQGIMTEALRAILEFGFTQLGLTTVEAYTQSNNTPSTKLLGRFGFGLLADRRDETNALNAVYALDVDNWRTEASQSRLQ